MGNIAAIRKSSWIKKLRQEGNQITGEFVILRYMKGGTNTVHGAFIVSAKIGSAVVRNKVKRRLREIFWNKVCLRLEPGFFAFVAKEAIKNADFLRVEKEILDLILRISERR